MTTIPRRHLLTALATTAVTTALAGVTGAESREIPFVGAPRPARTFVLVHGAWHTAAALDGVAQALTQAGHEVVVASLPGAAPGGAPAGITFADYVDAVVDAVRETRRRVILVGHSSGGMLLQAAAPRVHKRVAQVVFCNAFIVANGQSQLDSVPADAAAALGGLAAQNGGIVPIVPLDGFVRGALMEGDPVSTQDALLAQLVDQPFSLLSTPVDTAAFESLDVSRAVVFCRRDHSADYLGMTTRLGRYDVVVADGSHEMLFSSPKAFAKALLTVSI